MPPCPRSFPARRCIQGVASGPPNAPLCARAAADRNDRHQEPGSPPRLSRCERLLPESCAPPRRWPVFFRVALPVDDTAPPDTRPCAVSLPRPTGLPCAGATYCPRFLATAAFPGALVIARRHPLPVREMCRIGKLLHIGSQPGQKVLRPASVEAIDAIETAQLGRERAPALLQTRIEAGNLLRQKLHLLQECRQHEAMMLVELAPQTLLQLLRRGAQRPPPRAQSAETSSWPKARA